MLKLEDMIADNANANTNGAPRISEEDLALQFAETHAARMRYVAPWNKWLIWDAAGSRMKRAWHSRSLATWAATMQI
jgi:hypothetical protein